MPFDPISWGLGYTLSAATNAGHAALTSDSLEQRLTKEAKKWAAELGKRGLDVEAAALFPKTDGDIPETLPARLSLKTKLEAKRIPSADEWGAALKEQWKEIAEKLGVEAQVFFQVEEQTANAELERLAESLYQACRDDPALFHSTVLATLDELKSDQGDAGETPLYQQTLDKRLDEWFEALGYSVESRSSVENLDQWMLNIPNRRGFDRVVVHAVDGEANVRKMEDLSNAVAKNGADEGWLLADIRVSSAVREAVEKLARGSFRTV